MITEEYIMRLIEQYAQSPSGRAMLKKKYGIEISSDKIKHGTKTTSVKPSDMTKYGEEMKRILFSYVNPLIKSITLDDIVVGAPVKGTNGEWSMQISFRDGSLHRDSLDENDYPEGVSNIVLLFAKGYHARDYVYGLWNTTGYKSAHWIYWKDVRSRKDRSGDDFLIKAVNEFNSLFGKDIAKAELLGDYKEASENPN